MSLVWKNRFNLASKIAAMPRIDYEDSCQLEVDEIASMAVAAALAEIGRDDGARSGRRDPTKTRGRGLSGKSYCSTSTRDYPYYVTDDSCSVSTFSCDDFAHYDGNELFHKVAMGGGCAFFSALREMFCCEGLLVECNDDDADESRDESELTSDRLADSYPSRDGIATPLDDPRVLFSDTGSIYSIESKDSFRECIAKPPTNARVLFSDTGSCYTIGSKYDQGTSTTVKGSPRKKGVNWNLWTCPGLTEGMVQ